MANDPEGDEQARTPETWKVDRAVKTPAPGVDRSPPPGRIRDVPDATNPKILPPDRIR
jgi:hypothetical protein